MNVAELLQELKQRGVALQVEGDHLTYRAPQGVMTDNLRQAVISHKPKLLALLSCPDRGSAKMTLSEFASSGRTMRVRSRLLGEDVWWIANEGLRNSLPDVTLVAYTATELRSLINIEPEDLINIHKIKKTFNGCIEN